MKRNVLSITLGVLLLVAFSSVAMAGSGKLVPEAAGPKTYVGFDPSIDSIVIYNYMIDEATIDGMDATYSFGKKASFTIKQAWAPGKGVVLLVSGEDLNKHYKKSSDCKKINAAIGGYCNDHSITMTRYEDITEHLAKKKLPSNMVAVYICR